MTTRVSWAGWLAIGCGFPHTLYANGPSLMLAQPYQAVSSLTPYLISEKYDGMRAYWDGKRLLSRGGREIATPAWFVRGWPTHPLDGELWLGRGQFQALMRIVRDRVPDEVAWQQVQYRVFDRPDLAHPYSLRYEVLRLSLESLSLPHLHLVHHRRVSTAQALAALLDEVVGAGGEGLILRHQDGRYRPGRDPGMLKLKPRWDGEARVIGYLPGRGRLAGMMGALLVEDPEGRRFRLGSGFSDAVRRDPPPIGSVVTYSYLGRTDAGLPRFARYERVFTGL